MELVFDLHRKFDVFGPENRLKGRKFLSTFEEEGFFSSPHLTFLTYLLIE